MSKIGKEMLKREAKKIYKENVKNVPRRNRIPFSQFFKKYRELKSAEAKQKELTEPAGPEASEDFNFDEMVNINKDLQVEAPTPPPAVEEKKEEEKKE